MEATNEFKKVIKKYLDDCAFNDDRFSIKYENKNKNIDDCITYILNRVKDSKKNGYSDSEIYGMALHYYDEEEIEVGKEIKGRVIINHDIPLSAEEISKAKEEAKNNIIRDEMNRIKNIGKKKTKLVDKPQPTLF